MSEQVFCGIGRKSTVLLLLIIFCLLNTALFFRAAVNTLYFMEDPGKDYSEITATVTGLLPEKEPEADGKGLITPVFSFDYKGEMLTREAPALQYAQQESPTPYRIGDEGIFWIHDYRGEIILPPPLSRKGIGISQLVVSALSLVLAIVLWKVRNLLAGRRRAPNPDKPEVKIKS
ncbi:MAG: hypothetical protein GQ559_07230 [Desulfobulbaceae bacterium]|nr:hypothetical protein [Desulfobulbaceae bacterium]